MLRIGALACGMAIILLQSLAQADEPNVTKPAAGKASPDGSLQIAAVSYNIRRGLGNDSRTDLQRSAAVLSRLHADVIGLQEVDQGARRSGSVDQAAQLGRQLNMHHAFAPFMDYDGGRYGLAVLSRYPINRADAIPLPRGNEPRVALAVDVRLPDNTSIVVVNLHFDWVDDDRFRFAQATALKQYLERLDKRGKPYLLLGDFNDKPDSRTVRLFSETMAAAEKPADNRFTFASNNPNIEIDFIFAAPASRWLIDKVEVIDEALASDHRPVFSRWILSNR